MREAEELRRWTESLLLPALPKAYMVGDGALKAGSPMHTKDALLAEPCRILLAPSASCGGLEGIVSSREGGGIDSSASPADGTASPAGGTTRWSRE